MSQPTEPAVFPERAIRHAFPQWDDQRTIQHAWSGMPEAQRAQFTRMVEDADPARLPGAVAAFLDTPATEGPGTGGSTTGTGGGPPNAGDVSDELIDALATIETAEAWAEQNPDRIEALLDAEQAKEKPRSTLVDSLERAIRRRDREREGAGA